MGTNTELHAQDFYAWLEDTASLLRAGKWHDIDAQTLAEELDAVRSQERREALRRLRRLLQHLLKWQYQPSGRHTGHSWRSTIRTQRAALADMLDESPSMARGIHTLLTKGYPLARQWARDDMHLPLRDLPGRVPLVPGAGARCRLLAGGGADAMTEDAHISIPVPPPIAAAWQALPPERRASFATCHCRGLAGAAAAAHGEPGVYPLPYPHGGKGRGTTE